MAKVSPGEPGTGHVVHLLSTFGFPPTPPETLRFERRMGSIGRVLMALVLTVGTALFAGSLYILWTEETPGWWFDLLFSLMLIGLPVALWVAYFAAIREADEEIRMQEQWAVARAEARLIHGHVMSRDVRVAEDGTVNSFILTLGLADASRLVAKWRPPRESPRYILQTQVPSVGAEAHVWLLGEATPDRPLVAEVVDPSVVSPSS
ncbi:hypothetical protein [Luethyella okanaganae]|uniref:Uncharacterized protein n=1 Tax=Luethyella okanaganae TaxID=69372 RepID=A0ABW1VCX8_9MICO